MSDIGAFEAKTHLSQLLDRVSRGERITITRHGTPVATLGPIASPAKEDVKTTIAQLAQFGKEHKLGDLKLKEMVEEGRRF